MIFDICCFVYLIFLTVTVQVAAWGWVCALYICIVNVVFFSNSFSFWRFTFVCRAAFSSSTMQFHHFPHVYQIFPVAAFSFSFAFNHLLISIYVYASFMRRIYVFDEWNSLFSCSVLLGTKALLHVQIKYILHMLIWRTAHDWRSKRFEMLQFGKKWANFFKTKPEKYIKSKVKHLTKSIPYAHTST